MWAAKNLPVDQAPLLGRRHCHVDLRQEINRLILDHLMVRQAILVPRSLVPSLLALDHDGHAVSMSRNSFIV